MNRRTLIEKSSRIAMLVLPLGLATRLAQALGSPAANKASCDMPRNMAYFANIPLWTHKGDRVDFYNDLIKGQIFTINFMYTRCEVSCSGITQNLRKVQRMLGNRVGKDIFMYSITVDPDNDTPPVLNKYVEDNEIGPGWTFLTGSKKDIERLRKLVGLVDIDPQVDQQKSRHTGMLRIVNEPQLKFSAAAAQSSAGEIVRHIKGAFPVELREVQPTPGNFGRAEGPIIASQNVWPVGSSPVPFMAVPVAAKAREQDGKKPGDLHAAANR